MASVFDTIKTCIEQYPSLFACRSDVINQLFCVIGNGYEWIDGELVYDYPERPIADRLDKEDESLTSLLVEFDDKERLIEYQLSVRKRNSQYRFRIENAGLLAEISRPSPSLELFAKPVYPLCQYSALTTVPDDVKPDWLAAARESIFTVFAMPARHGLNEHQNNLDVADQALQQLAVRFGSPEGMPSSYAEWKALHPNL